MKSPRAILTNELWWTMVIEKNSPMREPCHFPSFTSLHLRPNRRMPEFKEAAEALHLTQSRPVAPHIRKLEQELGFPAVRAGRPGASPRHRRERLLSPGQSPFRPGLPRDRDIRHQALRGSSGDRQHADLCPVTGWCPASKRFYGLHPEAQPAPGDQGSRVDFALHPGRSLDRLRRWPLSGARQPAVAG